MKKNTTQIVLICKLPLQSDGSVDPGEYVWVLAGHLKHSLNPSTGGSPV